MSWLDEPSGEYPPNYFRNDNEAISKSSTWMNENTAYYIMETSATKK